MRMVVDVIIYNTVSRKSWKFSPGDHSCPSDVRSEVRFR